MSFSADVELRGGGEEMDGEYEVDFAFLEGEENTLAVLLFGSGAKGKSNNRYFYFYRKIWEDQKHRQELDRDELMEVLEKISTVK